MNKTEAVKQKLDRVLELESERKIHLQYINTYLKELADEACKIGERFNYEGVNYMLIDYKVNDLYEYGASEKIHVRMLLVNMSKVPHNDKLLMKIKQEKAWCWSLSRIKSFPQKQIAKFYDENMTELVRYLLEGKK